MTNDNYYQTSLVSDNINVQVLGLGFDNMNVLLL